MSQPHAAIKQPTQDKMILDKIPADLATPASRISYLLERGFAGTYTIPGVYSSVQLLPPSASWFRPTLDVLRSREELESLRTRWPKEVSIAEEAARKFTEKDRQMCRENYMLHWLIAIGDFEEADAMIAAGSVVIKQDYTSTARSPVGVAMMWGHEGYAKSLLERGIVEPPSPCQSDPRENRLGKPTSYIKISFDMIETLLKIAEGPAPKCVKPYDWDSTKWRIRDPQLYQMVLQREDIPFEQRKTMVERLRNFYKLPFSRSRKIVYDDGEEEEEQNVWDDYDSDGEYGGGGYQAPPELIEDEINSSWYTGVLTLPRDQMLWAWNWGWRFDFWHNSRLRKMKESLDEKMDDSWTINKTIVILGARSHELIEEALVWMRGHGFHWPASSWSWMTSHGMTASTKLAVLDNLLNSRGWIGRYSAAEIKKQQRAGTAWMYPTSQSSQKKSDMSMLLDHAVNSGSLQLAKSIWEMGWKHLADPETLMRIFYTDISTGDRPDGAVDMSSQVELLKWLLDDAICGKQIAELLLDRSALANFVDEDRYVDNSLSSQDDHLHEANTVAKACWKVVSNWPPAAQRISRDEAFKAAMDKLWGSVTAERSAAQKRNDLEMVDVDSEYSRQQPDYHIRRTSLKQAHAEGELDREIKQELALFALKLEELVSCHVQYRTAVQRRLVLQSSPETCKKVLSAIDRQHTRVTDEMINRNKMIIKRTKQMHLDAQRWASIY